MLELEKLIAKYNQHIKGRLSSAIPYSQVVSDLEALKENYAKHIKDAYEQGDMVGRAAIIRELNPTDKVVLKYPEIDAEEYYNQLNKS